MLILNQLRSHQGPKSKAQSPQVHRMTDKGQRVLLCDTCRRYLERNPHMARQPEHVNAMLELVEIVPGDNIFQHMTTPGRYLHFAAVEDRAGTVNVTELEDMERWKKRKG